MTAISRRHLLALAAISSASVALSGTSKGATATSGNNAVMAVLRPFISRYCEAMNAPALTLSLVSADGTPRTSAYGYVDLAARTPAQVSDLFEIGSITKSFAAFTILQLVDEGKVELEAPIRGYLPWLAMETDFGEITAHHLLTHTSGMPADEKVFPSDPQQRVRQSCAPGAHFYYSNWGYAVLGYLIEAVDGQSWPAAVSARILLPLGMTDTLPAITSAGRSRIGKSYTPLHDDRPYPRHGPLTAAGSLTVTFADGSIASTPHDMGLYMQMILNRGRMPHGRIVSEENFKRFSTPHTPAAEFGPTASYGYGIAMDTLDGNTRLRHTGGMASFMSAMQLDLKTGYGAFASVNAQLGYRPNPVVQFALQLLRAQKEGRALPKAPAVDETLVVEDGGAYEGVYARRDGRQIVVSARAGRLTLHADGRDIPLQHAEEDAFITDVAEFARFPLLFGRDVVKADGAASISLAAAHRWWTSVTGPIGTRTCGILSQST